MQNVNSTLPADQLLSESSNEQTFYQDEEIEETKWSKLSRILRSIGGLVLITSACAFLLQEWVGLDSVIRYYSFLGFTLVLAGAGVFCGVKMREAKGARTFMSISALFLPAHFAQLGALVYSLFLDNHQALFSSQSSYVRNLAIYQAPSVWLTAVTIIIAAACLIPIAFSGFSALARSHAKLLTILYTGANALLLVPTRNSIAVTLLSLGAITLLAAVDRISFSSDSAMKTKEGAIVRFMLFAPVAIMLLRSLVLYSSAILVLSAFSALAAAFLFIVIPSFFNEREPKEFFQGLSTVPAGLFWLLFIKGVYYPESRNLFFGPAYADLFLPLAYLPLSALLTAMSFSSAGSGNRYRKLAGTVAILSMLLQLFTVPAIVSSILCIIVSIAIIAAAFAMEEKTLLTLGSIGLGSGLLYQLRYAADLFTLSPWLSLAVMGTLTIFAASYIERNHGRLIEGFNKLQGELKEWD